MPTIPVELTSDQETSTSKNVIQKPSIIRAGCAQCNQESYADGVNAIIELSWLVFLFVY